MDFNDIQSAWNDEQYKDLRLPANPEKLKSVNTPLDKIKKNLRKEAIIQVIAIILIGLIPISTSMNPDFLLAYYLLYVVSFIISLYFSIRLYIHYRNFSTVTVSAKDSLYEVYYNIRLYMETYKSFSYALVPFGLMYMFLIPLGKESGRLPALLLAMSLQTKVLLFIGIVGIFMGLMWLMTEAHVKTFYGKYADEIRRLIDELKE